MRAEIERLRKLLESQAEKIKKLECQLTENTPPASNGNSEA
jgi:hypothetical protein